MPEHTLTNNQLIAGKTKQVDSSEALIQKTPGVCGGRARIRKTRIPVWTLVSFRSLGASDRELLANYPSLTQSDLSAAWLYYEHNSQEIDAAIVEQDDEEDEENG